MARTMELSALAETCVDDEVWKLVRVGKVLDELNDEGITNREWLSERWLTIRMRDGRLMPLRWNRAQREFAKARGRKHIVLKARQLGITTYVASRFFLNTILNPGTVTVQVAHDQDSAEALFRIVYRFLENLPESVRVGALRTSRANVRQIVWPEMDSEYRVETAADPNAGRGLTINNLHCSEVARWPRNAVETLASLRAAVPRDGEIVLESTPNGAGGCFYEEWQKARENGYTRHFFPWWYEGSYRADESKVGELTSEEIGLMEAFDLTREQIAFRRGLQLDFGKLARQEFAESAEQCFLASGECFFDVDVIEKRLAEVHGPNETRENGRIAIFYPARRGKEYVIGVDPAGGGTSGDYAAAQVVDRKSGLQCAELQGHYRPAELARRVEELGHEYNDALIAVERNNHGAAVLVCLEQSGYPKLYEQNGQAGWLTTCASRPRMLEKLAVRLRTEPEKFESRRLLEECKSFVRREDGSAAAASGAHDDLVMAMGVAVGAS